MNKTIYLLLLLIVFSCKEEIEQDINWTKDDSIELNSEWAEDEEFHIQQYLKRRPKWQMEETGTGLRYMIFQRGDGDSAVRGYYAKVDYKISLLTEEVLYSSDESGPTRFKIDYSEVESGLQEGDRKSVV